MNKLLLFGVAGLVGCDAGDVSRGSDSSQSSIFTRIVGEATVDDCPNGGVVLDQGIDINGNGVLDDNEVSETVTVCRGQNGANALTSLIDEPPGENCAYGGTAIQVGVDLDGDDVLDPEEITDTEYVCDGAPGVGSPCEGGTIEGSFTIENAADAALLVGCTTITGYLYVADGVPALDLSALTSVGGSLEMRNTALTTLDLSALTSVGGDFIISGDATLGAIDLSSLVFVGEQLAISHLAPSTALGFPSLTSIGSSLSVMNSAVTSLDLPALTSVAGWGGIHMAGNTALAALDLSSLTATNDLSIDDTALTTLDLSALTSVDGELRIHNNDVLTTVDLSALTSIDANLDIVDNAVLTALDMSVLTSVSSAFQIYENPSLPTCVAQGILDQLIDYDGEATIYGNNDAGSCE